MGIVVWNYFVEVTSGSVSAIVGRGDLLRKLNFPKYVIILAGSFSALINLALNGVILVLFMTISGVDVSRYAILAPFIFLELFVFSLSLAFILSALFVKFRDLNYIWEVVLQGGFYATPILYPLSIIPISAAKFLMLNPLAQIIQDLRYMFITPETLTIGRVFGTEWARVIPISITIIMALVSGLYFKKRSKYFAEEV